MLLFSLIAILSDNVSSKERTYEHKPDHKSGGGLLDLDADADVKSVIPLFHAYTS